MRQNDRKAASMPNRNAGDDDSTGCVVDDLSDNMGEMMAISFRNLEKAANVKLPVQKTRAQKAEERRRKKEEQLKRDEMRLETEFIGKVVKKKQKEVSGHELITKNQVNSLLNLVFENKESRSSKNKERSSSVAVNFPDEPRNRGRNQEVVKDQRPTRIKSSSRRSKSLQASVPDFPAEKYNDIREDERGSNQGTQGNINEKISSEEKLDSLRDICDQEIKDEQIDESEVHFMKSVRKGHDCRTVSQSSYEEVMKEPKNEEGANDFDKEYNDNMNANSKEFDLEYDLDAVGSRNDECIKQTDEEYDNYDAVERQEWDLQETYEYTPSEPDDEEVNWESGGIEEDGDLPDLISLPNERAELDIEAFRNKFLHLKFHDEMDAYLKDTNKRQEEERVIHDSFRCQLPTSSGDHHILFPVTNRTVQDTWFKLVKASEIDAYYNFLAQFLRKPSGSQKNSPCPSTCACRGLWDTNAYALTPLHLAAALANPHFLESIINEEIIRKQFILRLGDNPDTRKLYEHYQQKVEDWLKKRKKGGRMSAMDVAVEQGRIDNLKVFLRQPMAEVLLALDMKNPYDKYLKTEAFDCKVQHVSLLSRLIENFHLDKLDEEEKRIVITYVTEQQLIHAIDMSLTRGNVENLIILGKYHPHVSDDYLGDYLAQDEEESNVFPGRNLKKEQTPITPPAAHLLAQYGHYQTFSKLTKEHKRSLDQFKFTALSSVLEFENDEDVKKELNAFKSVGREDIFVFVSQIIVKHKKGQSPALLQEVLKMVLSNSLYFNLPYHDHPVYEHYGLPSYVPLPLETALTRTENLGLFVLILDMYWGRDKFVKPMIEEDVFRCLQSIQDRALRVTEHLRLTIITMMMPYVNTLSERFDEIMRMYSNTSYQDNVAQYVLTLTKPRCRSNYMKTLLEAREVVNSWGGSVEAENYAQNVVSVSKNSDQPPSDNSSRSILKKREGNDEIRMLIDENEEQKHLEEMIKLEKAFIVFQRMNGEDENSMKDEIYI